MNNYNLVCAVILIVSCAVSLYEYKLLLNNKKILNSYENMRKRLSETSGIISKTNDETTIYSIALDTIIELIPKATNGGVLIFDEEKNRFYFKVVKGFQSELVDFTIIDFERALTAADIKMYRNKKIKY